ncbi:MAG: sulfite exporter TauE/SafE family protein [Hyphomicrobiales bacterium]|nr:sulfite exporter TauE/SafE family protein [Hyphomicrobiales bacterium]MDE2283333.1 sulfite exporter TauE/SafE family protein [Hyphomicrobiales bacterium]
MTAIAGIAPIYAVAGFVVGMLVGMTGVGGGSLMTPVLILLFGIHPAVAVGTDLLHAAVTKTSGTLVHGFSRTIDWNIVRRLALGSMPMTAVVILAMSAVDINGATGRVLINVVLTIALVVTMMVLIFRDRIVKYYADRLGKLTPKQTGVLTVLAGAVLGTIVSVSSVGAGAIGATCLILLYPKLPTARIVGSDIAHAVPLTLLAGIGHWALGSIDLQIFGYLILGSVPGILLGSFLAIRIPEHALRVVLALVLMVATAKLAIGLLPPGSPVVASESPR